MFNLGVGELTVLLLLALIFVGPKRLPDLGAGLGEMLARRHTGRLREPAPLLLQRRESRRWSVSDWLLVLTAVGLGVLVIWEASGRCTRP